MTLAERVVYLEALLLAKQAVIEALEIELRKEKEKRLALVLARSGAVTKSPR